MWVRAIKLSVVAAVGFLILAGQARAATVIMSPGGGPYALVQGNVYSAGSGIGFSPGPLLGQDFTVSLAGADAPLTTVSTSITLPFTGAIKNLTIAWFDSANNLIDDLLVTNAAGTIINVNAALVIALTQVGNYTIRVTGEALTQGASYLLNVTTTPLPPAVILFGTALAGVTWLSRRRRGRAAPMALG
ncbi:MAG: hypothetical protein ACM31O_02385 [Bacteroidota bacterium]|jgi:hypothetical protein